MQNPTDHADRGRLTARAGDTNAETGGVEQLGEKFCALTTTDAQAMIVRRNAQLYGMNHKLTSVRYVSRSSTFTMALVRKYKKADRAKAPEVREFVGAIVEQFVRAEVVWRDEPGLTVPATSVTRINGQYFAYLVQKNDKGFVAKQHAVKLGELRNNEYVVVDGLKAGDQLIVSGVQKVADGAPVQPQT